MARLATAGPLSHHPRPSRALRPQREGCLHCGKGSQPTPIESLIVSALPWVRFFPSDWLAGTRGMTAAETGVYISLIAMMYERGEPLAEDAGRLARLCGASNSQFQKVLETLLQEGKLIRVEGGLWNARVEKEQVYRSEKSEVGKQAAEKRWQKTQQKQSRGDANAMRLQSERNANQKPEPESEITPPAPQGGSARAKRGTRVDDFQPDPEVAEQLGLSPERAKLQAAKFLNYWRAVPGAKGLKLDWPATWRNWVLTEVERHGGSTPKPRLVHPPPANVPSPAHGFAAIERLRSRLHAAQPAEDEP